MRIKVLIFIGLNEVRLYNLSITNPLKMKVTLATLFLNAAAIGNLKCLIEILHALSHCFQLHYHYDTTNAHIHYTQLKIKN